jgi:serine/threonine-protein kinase
MESGNVEAMSLKSGVTKTLVAGAYFGRYLPENGTRGYLLYLHQGVLFGAAFDPNRLEIQGTPETLLGDVAANPFDGGGQFDYSAAPSGHGTLVYLAGKGPTGQTWPVVWLDSSGKMQPLIATPGAYMMPRFSPDGRRLALAMNTGSGPDIYSYDLPRDTMTRLTMGGTAQLPVWRRCGDLVDAQRRLRRCGGAPGVTRQGIPLVLLPRRAASGLSRAGSVRPLWNFDGKSGHERSRPPQGGQA